MNENIQLPSMMTVRQVAGTGILPENAIRVLLRQGKISAVYSGRTAYVNFGKLVEFLNNLEPINVA